VKPGWAIYVILERACGSDLHRADSVEIRRLSEGFVPKKKLVVSGKKSRADQLPA
jgi:hypothetical protein